MTPVRAPNGCDFPRVTGRGQPVVNGGADSPTFDMRAAGPLVSGNQQEHAFAGADRLLERPVDRRPGAIEIHAMEVEHPVGNDVAPAQLPVPAAVERCSGSRSSRRCGHRGANRHASPTSYRRDQIRGTFRFFFGWVRFERFPGKRPDRCRDPRPEGGFLSAERPHGRPRPWEGGCRRLRSRSCCRRSASLPGRLPRTCRSDWLP